MRAWRIVILLGSRDEIDRLLAVGGDVDVQRQALQANGLPDNQRVGKVILGQQKVEPAGRLRDRQGGGW